VKACAGWRARACSGYAPVFRLCLNIAQSGPAATMIGLLVAVLPSIMTGVDLPATMFGMLVVVLPSMMIDSGLAAASLVAETEEEGLSQRGLRALQDGSPTTALQHQIHVTSQLCAENARRGQCGGVIGDLCAVPKRVRTWVRQ
jgi:hypothetical protein